MGFFPQSAIILAGGMGTRLKAVVADVPKPMAPVAGKPFLHYQFLYLQQQGIQQVVLSVGYKAEVIEQYFGNTYNGIEISYCHEEQPLGTGGGIKKAMEQCGKDCFILNGDTFFDVDLKTLAATQQSANADLTLALSHQKEFDRYGTVDFDTNHRITAFKEKQFLAEGWINGGVYCANKDLFSKVEASKGMALPQVFSFEKEVLEGVLQQLHIHAGLYNSYFIDIGIPEDYAKADREFGGLFKH